MAPQSAATAKPIAERKPSKGGAVDGRTLVARRRRELITTFANALGGAAGLTEGQSIDVARAAELTALAEQARARALREGTGDAAELSAMIRLESTAARAVRGLGLPRAGANQAKPESIVEYAARRAAEKAAQTPAGEPA